MVNLTEFGTAVRKARLDAKVKLQTMAEELETSPAFLSSLEVGRKKIPRDWVKKIETYFVAKKVEIPKLAKLADVANKAIPLEGMSPQKAMLLAGFARTNISKEQMAQLSRLLKEFEKE